MWELDCALEFDSAHEENFFAALPQRQGVLLIELRSAGGDAQPYLARTADIRRAAERLLRIPEAGAKRLNLREAAVRIRYRRTGSKFEQMLAISEQARRYFRSTYRKRLRLRPPAVLKVNLRNSYPRCYVTRGIRPDEGFYYGPFASRRAADAFLEGLLDFFKVRRCQIKIRRDPSFPGCIYSEMKMCLAPCFGGCSYEEYGTETARLLETLESSGAALTEAIEREREAASDALDFERAAALHKRLEKARAALRGLPEIARRIGELDAVILQRSVEEMAIVVFPVRGGILRDPIPLRFAEISSQPRSVEAILREALDPAAVAAPAAEVSPVETDPAPSPGTLRQKYGLKEIPPELSDHLALVARWFYSNPREGEIFFREADWPYRRILRACGRLLHPSGSEDATKAPKQ
ncbi:MAG TPA: hypothetical protein VN661_09990 [Candidatus Acidoferrales bacterium]|nr:hypothetical protein [Candidatus Acidoferrales bacterium]